MSLLISLLIAASIGVSSLVLEVPKDNIEIIQDFSGNTFVLKEGVDSYEIYTNNNIFLEGSNSTNSPFYNKHGDKYYLGPSNYYLRQNDSVTNIINGDMLSLEECKGYSYSLEPTIEVKGNTPTGDPNKTYEDSNGFTVINNADYFRNLDNFPQNWFGECGVVALSELLGYYDTFYNDDFIPNNLKYDARYYKRKETKNSESSEYELDRTEVEYLSKNIKVPNKDSDSYDFSEWGEMPGTSYAMHDYIFDKYMKTYMGIGWPDGGYPMLDGELKATMNDYMKANCNHLLQHTEFRSGNIFFTHQKPKEYLAEGLPTLLVLQSYDSSIGSGNNHVVLSYGYKNDNFLCHFGWWPGSKSSAEVVLNSATIYGYFTIKYNGEHNHSSNVSMDRGNVTSYICGCGKVHEKEYSISPIDWNFDARYYFENEGIKNNTIQIDNLKIDTSRLRCGFIENEYINLSPNRYNAGYAYLDLTFDNFIYAMNTQVSFWSSNEGMNKGDGDFAYIKYLDSAGNWSILVDLLDRNLSTNKTKQTELKLSIPSGTKRIMIEAYKANPNTDRNKGRLSIGKTSFVTKI